MEASSTPDNSVKMVVVIYIFYLYSILCLTLTLLTWRIWWASNNASNWQMGFNWVFRGLRTQFEVFSNHDRHKRKIKGQIITLNYATFNCCTQEETNRMMQGSTTLMTAERSLNVCWCTTKPPHHPQHSTNVHNWLTATFHTLTVIICKGPLLLLYIT
jgi:hypothetical protein